MITHKFLYSNSLVVIIIMMTWQKSIINGDVHSYIIISIADILNNINYNIQNMSSKLIPIE